ncbi:MAG: hypothetical protein PHU23_00070 [Dehalococcoidales bacterium]|nr:hypothetical protein [Dehalococcoidales bacterium]
MAKIKAKMILRKMPASHPLSEHQLQIREINQKCGIKKGITQAEFQEAMRTCIPEEWKKLREEQNAPPSGHYDPTTTPELD